MVQKEQGEGGTFSFSTKEVDRRNKRHFGGRGPATI